MEDFLEDLRNDHRDFDLAKLEEIVGTNPFDLFNQWMKNAVDKGVAEANACVVSTVDATGQPSGRIIYLKELINGEFIFYTNYHSHKGKDIAGNNKVSLLFFWPALQQQIQHHKTQLQTYPLLLRVAAGLQQKQQQQQKEQLELQQKQNDSQQLQQQVAGLREQFRLYSDRVSDKQKLVLQERLIAELSSHRAKLQPGDECPLCGSTTHPAITSYQALDLTQTEAELATLTAELKQVE